jgi:integrase
MMRRKSRRIATGSFASVIRAFMCSPKFDALSRSTRVSWAHYLSIAELPETLGAISVDVIRPALVQAFLDGFADRPGAQRSALIAIKAVEKWALVRDLLPFPITHGCEIIGSSGGHKPWTDEQVDLVERCARPEISRAVTLLANTGQRGSDVIRMRWSDIEDVDGHPGINVVQQKTGRRLWVPFTPALIAKIAVWERRPTVMLLRSDGTPFPSRGHLTGAWDREKASNPEIAQCSDLVLHGLRATAVVRLRRAGAKGTQIADMIGMSVPMVERYCRFADQRKSAMAAVVHLRGRTENKTRNGTE